MGSNFGSTSSQIIRDDRASYAFSSQANASVFSSSATYINATK